VILGVTQNHMGGEFVRNLWPDQHLRGKRTVKVWKPKKVRRRLVMGMDIGLEDSCNLALCALVGRLDYRSHCSTSIDKWV
jgi:hypothetical protein